MLPVLRGYHPSVLLAGDIGGTRARLTLITPDGKRRVRQEVLESQSFPSLEAAVKSFLGPRPPKITAACLGVAGPVVNHRCTATNLPWVVDARVVSRKLKIRRVTLINDLVALAFGALTVPPSRLKMLQGDPPKRKGAHVAVIAAGTGLGQAILVWDGLRFVPLATEGGHSDFAPRDELEFDLLRFLGKRHRGRVSYERVLSGAGLSALYDFFKLEKGIKESKAISEEIEAAPDRNEAITNAALAGRSEAAARAVDLFVSIYGAEAGNLALKSLSLGGVYVAGGIAAPLLSKLEEGPFLESFSTKGRFSSLLRKIPVAVVVDTDIGLSGAAYFAMHPAG